MPPKPLVLHIAADVSEEDATAYRDAALRWNRALGVTAIQETDVPGHCGVRVVRGDGLEGASGKTGGVRDCLLRTRLRPNLDGAKLREDVAAHELGHALLSSTDGDHSDDERSVLFSAPGELITADDVARVSAVLPDEMAAHAVATPER